MTLIEKAVLQTAVLSYAYSILKLHFSHIRFCRFAQRKSIVSAAEGFRSPGLSSEQDYPVLSGTAFPIYSMS